MNLFSLVKSTQSHTSPLGFFTITILELFKELNGSHIGSLKFHLDFIKKWKSHSSRLHQGLELRVRPQFDCVPGCLVQKITLGIFFLGRLHCSVRCQLDEDTEWCLVIHLHLSIERALPVLQCKYQSWSCCAYSKGSQSWCHEQLRPCDLKPAGPWNFVVEHSWKSSCILSGVVEMPAPVPVLGVIGTSRTLMILTLHCCPWMQ